MLQDWSKEAGDPSVVMDIHCPWLRGSWLEKDNSNEYIYTVGIKAVEPAQRRFCESVERVQCSGLGFLASDYYAEGRGWNTGSNYKQGSEYNKQFLHTIVHLKFVLSYKKCCKDTLYI